MKIQNVLKSKTAKITLAVALVAGASLATYHTVFAGRTEEELRELIRIATARNLSIKGLNDAWGEYKKARDQDILGRSNLNYEADNDAERSKQMDDFRQAGIAQKMEFINKKAVDWYQGWIDLVAHIQAMKTEGMESVEAQIQKDFQRQNNSLNVIKYYTQILTDHCDRVAKEMDSLPIAEVEIKDDGQREKFEKMKVARQDLVDGLAWMRKVSADTATSLGNIAEQVRGVAQTRLKIALIDSAITDVENNLKRILASIDAQKRFTQTFSELEARYFAIYRANLDGRVFRARKDGALLAQACVEAIASVQSADVVPTVRDKALAELNRESAPCKAGQKLVASMTYPDNMYAKLVRRGLMSRYNQRCLDGDPKLTCERYGVLQAISNAQIDQMTPEDLEFYENQWEQVDPALAPKGK